MVAGNLTTCARKTNGAVSCWGSNANGQAGDGTFDDRSTPGQVGSDTNWAHLTVGERFVCATKATGALFCWGFLGDVLNQVSPLQVGAATDWATVEGGSTHACARKTNGTLFCWGLNGEGQLGLGDRDNRASPEQVGAATDWTKIGPGHNFTCARKTNGTLFCWGANGSGQLGDYSSNVGRSLPGPVSPANDWTAVSSGLEHACATTSAGALWCWGLDLYAQLGDNAIAFGTSPLRIP